MSRSKLSSTAYWNVFMLYVWQAVRFDWFEYDLESMSKPNVGNTNAQPGQKREAPETAVVGYDVFLSNKYTNDFSKKSIKKTQTHAEGHG